MLSGTTFRSFLLKVAFCLSVLFVAAPTYKGAAQYEDDYVSYYDFYQGLAPYGQWVEDPQYGYVWSPDVDASFRPYYTNGYWLMTEYGNTWISEYPWGWACFHYGRWTYDNYYGWLWVPGSNWAPAWVAWRYGEGYYGWAPLSPVFTGQESIMSFNCPQDWWVFIPPQYLYTGKYYNYWYGPRGNSRIINSTTIITNTFDNNHVVYYTGPSAASVGKITGRPVSVYKVRSSRSHNTRVHNEIVHIYKPATVNPGGRGEGSQPPNVMSAPYPVHKPQSIATNNDGEAPFRATINDRRNANVTPGTSVNPTAEPAKTHTRTENPYEWDVTRPVKQDPVPRSKPKPAPAKQPAPQTRTPAAGRGGTNTPPRSNTQPTQRQPASTSPANSVRR